MAELIQRLPRCGSCNVVGSSSLLAERINENYIMFYCKSCGAIHSIVPDLSRLAAALQFQAEPASYFDEEPLEPPTPRCPQHNLPLYRVTVPEGYREAGQEFLVCPKKGECKYYQPVEDEAPPAPQRGEDEGQPTPQRGEDEGQPARLKPPPSEGGLRGVDRRGKPGAGRVSIFTDRAAMIDLACRAAEKSRKMTPNQIGAMAHDGGGLYQFGLVAPLCVQHQVPMEMVIVPGGYSDAGERFWFCPQIEACGKWDRVRPDEAKRKK